MSCSSPSSERVRLGGVERQIWRKNSVSYRVVNAGGVTARAMKTAGGASGPSSTRPVSSRHSRKAAARCLSSAAEPSVRSTAPPGKTVTFGMKRADGGRLPIRTRGWFVSLRSMATRLAADRGRLGLSLALSPGVCTALPATGLANLPPHMGRNAFAAFAPRLAVPATTAPRRRLASFAFAQHRKA